MTHVPGTPDTFAAHLYTFASRHLFFAGPYIIRVAIAALLSLGLVLSSVGAGMAQAHMAKCEQMMRTLNDDCGCCGDNAACSSSACVAQCSNTQAGLTTDTGLMPVSREKLRIDPSAFVRSLTVSPDPPPPRS